MDSLPMGECPTPGCPGQIKGHACYGEHTLGSILELHANGECLFEDPCWTYGTPGRLRKRRRLLRELGIATGYIDLEIVVKPDLDPSIDEAIQQVKDWLFRIGYICHNCHRGEICLDCSACGTPSTERHV